MTFPEGARLIYKIAADAQKRIGSVQTEWYDFQEIREIALRMLKTMGEEP